MADIDPLRLDKTRFRSHPDLEVLTHGLTLWDLDRVFKVNGFAGCEYKKLRDVLGLLRDAYCRHIGVEYTHILDPEQQEWLEERVETKHVKPTVAEQKYILSKLNAAEAFETFLQTKYVGQKRFSLEGAETLIPILEALVEKARTNKLMPDDFAGASRNFRPIGVVRRIGWSSQLAQIEDSVCQYGIRKEGHGNHHALYRPLAR